MASQNPPNLNDRPLRVFHVVSGDLWAGAEAQFLQLIEAMSNRQDLEVRVAVLNPGILAERLRPTDVTLDIFDERQQSALQIINKNSTA